MWVVIKSGERTFVGINELERDINEESVFKIGDGVQLDLCKEIVST